MFDFDKNAELNLVKLSKRRAEYGEICLVEAAVIAAGYELRTIKSFPDCPPGFSKPITEYAFMLNDSMPDALRNELLKPFIPRLAGIAGSEAIEQARAAFIIIATMRRITSILCREAIVSEELGSLCENARSLDDVKVVGEKLEVAISSSEDDVIQDVVKWSYKGIGTWVDMDYAVAVARKTAVICDSPRTIFTIAAEILDGAIKYRRQA